MILTIVINIVMTVGFGYIAIGAVLALLAGLRPQPALAVTVEQAKPRQSIPVGGWVEPATPEIGMAVELFAVAVKDYWRSV